VSRSGGAGMTVEHSLSAPVRAGREEFGRRRGQLGDLRPARLYAKAHPDLAVPWKAKRHDPACSPPGGSVGQGWRFAFLRCRSIGQAAVWPLEHSRQRSMCPIPMSVAEGKPTRDCCVPVPLATPLASRQLLFVRVVGTRKPLLRKGRRGDLGSAGPQQGGISLSRRRFLSQPGDLVDLVPGFQRMENQPVIGWSRRRGLESRLPGRSEPATNLAFRLAAAPVWWNCVLVERLTKPVAVRCGRHGAPACSRRPSGGDRAVAADRAVPAGGRQAAHPGPRPLPASCLG
jgi:hypothetical protein